MRKGLYLTLVVLLFAWCVGCATGKSLDGVTTGGGGGGSTASFTAGNWSFTTNGGINGAIALGGYLTSSGTTVSGNLFVVGSTGSGFTLQKSSTSMPVTGTLTSGTLTLSGTISSSTFAMTFTNVSSGATSVAGTYTVTGGTDTGDSGTVSGVISPSGAYTGTWAGTDTTTGGTMSVAMTESTSANTNGSFTLNPTSGGGVTFSGVTGCSVTGALNTTYSYAAGGIVFLDVTTADSGVSGPFSGELTFLGVANDASNPTTLSGGGYIYTGGNSCMLQSGVGSVSFSLTKQ